MKEEERNHISEELLFRHFAGETNSSEEDTIHVWVSASNENKAEYERIRIFFLDMKAIRQVGKEGRSYDQVSAWQKVKAKQSKEAAKTGVQINISYRFMRIAAAVVLLIGAGWFGYDRLFQVNQLMVAATDAIHEQVLADGSVTTLNKNSQLTYPDKFIGSRTVSLQGEAYFDVVSDPDKPFIIEAGSVQVKVLGTSFNVNAYQEEDSVLVSVDTGKVSMVADANEAVLIAGDVGVYSRSSGTLITLRSSNIGMHNYWRTKMLIFNGATLSEVIKSIKHTYGQNILLAEPGIGKCKISVSFEDESFESVLAIITTTLNLQWTLRDQTYILSGNGCDG